MTTSNVKYKNKFLSFSPPDISDEDVKAVSGVLKSGWLTTGRYTKEFENAISQYCGTKKTVCMNSATNCLFLCLKYLGIKPGDEIITTPYTYTATANVISYTGAKTVFCDLYPGTYEMDYEKLQEVITSRTKAIILVDIAGNICDYDAVYKVIEKSEKFIAENNVQEKLGRICLISDSAHGFGGQYKGKMSGAIADFTCFSFHAVKNLVTGEGGAVTWKEYIFDDRQVYNFMKYGSLHGQNKDALEKNRAGTWEYDISFHGYKCNMADINAALGLSQLKRYESILARRREIYELYSSIFHSDIYEIIPVIGKNQKGSAHLFQLRIKGMTEEQRNNVICKMADNKIAVNVHYKPLPMMTAFKNDGFRIDDYPNAYTQYANEITLPLHMKLANEDVEYISENLIRAMHETMKF